MYVPLYIKTNYSLLSSVIKIDQLLECAKKHHISSLAITDNNMFATMEFYHKCRQAEINPIIGLEVELENDILLLYAKNYRGYQTLIKLSTIQSERKISQLDIENNHEEVIAIVPFSSRHILTTIQNIIPDCYLGYQNKQEEIEAKKISQNIVYVNQTLYLDASESEYLKYLYMIRDGKTIADTTFYDLNDHELRLENIYEYSTNTGLWTTEVIANQCRVEFPETQLLLPIFETGKNVTSDQYLENLAKAGLARRLNNQVPASYANRLNYELSIIEKMGFSNYFLVVYDFIKYAKKNKILVGPGRGSGAGSLVCYSIGITDIDPIQYDLLFERFLNPERISMPDIDTDFPDIYRDQVIQYVIQKYGQKRVSGIVTFGTLAAKQALRDVARVLNVPSYQIDLITKRIPNVTKQKLPDFYHTDKELKNIIDSEKKLQLMFKIACHIEGFPRHTSSHAAGIVMCKKDLDEVIPLTKSDTMYLSGFSMEYLEPLGLLKMDFLGLRTLTTIMHIMEEITKKENITIDFNRIPLDDKKVLALFQKADTTGIFQFESEGMKNFLRNLEPNSFEDIFAAIALFRPGPASNIDSYIRRKKGQEEITYLDPCLEPILKSTKGIIIYQEQIMQIANQLAGYSLGEADILRKAMSKKKSDVLKNEEEKFIRQSVERGHTQEIAKQIFDLILNFANFGFNRSHSVAYSLIAYKMAYLKVYFPKYFYSSLLSSVIGSDSKTKEYTNEIKAKKIKIKKPCINQSGKEYIVEPDGIRYPLTGIKNVGLVSVEAILANRQEPYTDIFDFVRKNADRGINSKVFESLIDAGCFDLFGYNHHTLHHNLDSILNYAELVKDLDSEYVLKPEIEVVEEYSKEYLINKEKELFGIYLSNHPVTFYKAKYSDIVSLDQIKDNYNRKVKVIVLIDKVRTIKTKNGDDMMFLWGSDEYQAMDFTLFPKTYQRYLNMSLQSNMIVKIEGKVERRYDKFQVIVDQIEWLNQKEN